jgi:hypothetical protein
MEKGKKMSDTKFPFISALEKTIQKCIEDNNFVEVVRCKDCKWGTPHPEGDEYTKCFKLCTTFFSGHYCAWGERKEDG